MEAIRTVSARPDAPIRTTRAEVELGAIADNLRWLRGVVPVARIYPVVKADAYGHGLIPVAKALQRAGADGLCVALAEEGLRLRDEGVRLPLLVLGGAYGSGHAQVLEAGLTPVVFDLEQARDFARVSSREVRVHLKVDTGMARLGVPLSELRRFVQQLRELSNVRIEGLMTHLAAADSNPAFTRRQLVRFAEARRIVEAAGYRPTVSHAANSAGVLGWPEAHLDLVRPGIALYGVSPLPGTATELRLAMRVVTHVTSLREVPAETPLGYDGSFVTRRRTRVATLPMGYGDGLLRAASNRAVMLVRGQRCPVVGRVCMDLTCLDVTDLPACEVGDDVVVIGSQGDEVLRPEELAEACGTIPYEIFTALSSRVPRVYV